MICWGLADITLALRLELTGHVLEGIVAGPCNGLRYWWFVCVELNRGSFSQTIICLSLFAFTHRLGALLKEMHGVTARLYRIILTESTYC